MRSARACFAPLHRNPLHHPTLPSPHSLQVPFELPKKKKKVEKEGATEAEEKHEEL